MGSDQQWALPNSWAFCPKITRLLSIKAVEVECQAKTIIVKMANATLFSVSQTRVVHFVNEGLLGFYSFFGIIPSLLGTQLPVHERTNNCVFESEF